MKLYVVLTTTSQNQPFVEIVTDQKSVAELYQQINLDKGMFTVVVEKELNRLPEKSKMNKCANATEVRG